MLRSIFPEPLLSGTSAQNKRFMLKNLALHFRPTTVSAKTLRFSLTWGLGGMAATLVVLQLVTGILLKFVYEPTPVVAYASIQTIINHIPFGRLIRNMHHWCAHLLVAIAGLHLLRVYFTGAFQAPRQFNWVVGLCLLGTVLLANFTGYLLPWDQLAFWAVTVSTGMLAYIPIIGMPVLDMIREGTEIGPATLQMFYALHTAVIPTILMGLMAFHFWRVRKAGGLVIPRTPEAANSQESTRVRAVPHLLLREIVVALVVIAAVLLVSAWFDAPLTDPANPGLSPNPIRAPWYFAGLQELLLHFHPLVAVCLIPILIAGALLVIPYLKVDTNTAGIWFASRKGRKTSLVAVLTGLTLTPVLIMVNEGSIFQIAFTDSLPPVVADGMLPAVIIMALISAFFWLIKKGLQVNRNEAVQALFILLLAAYGALTVTGIWFRGAGMALVPPW